MSEIINETINELDKPTQNNVFSIEDDPVTVLEKINQVERYLKQIDTRVDTSINTANEAMEKANTAFEANGTLVKINGENQLTWSADFAESERQKSKNLFNINNCLYHKSSNLGETGTNITTFDSNIRITLSPNNLIKVNPNTQYTLSTNNSNFKYAIGQLTSNNTTLGDNGWHTNSSFTITTSSTTEYLGINFGKTDDSEISDTDYNNFLSSNIQLEEGSVATDYQPYNGAIVHEKDIADVEHIKVVYDKSSSNSAINWAYNNGLKAEAQLDGVLEITPPVSLKATSKYRVYVNWGGDINIFTASVNQYGNRISGCSAVWAYNLSASELQMCEFQYLSDINQIQLRFRKLSPSVASIEIQTSQYVYITKIEEIY